MHRQTRSPQQPSSAADHPRGRRVLATGLHAPGSHSCWGADGHGMGRPQRPGRAAVPRCAPRDHPAIQRSATRHPAMQPIHAYLIVRTPLSGIALRALRVGDGVHARAGAAAAAGGWGARAAPPCGRRAPRGAAREGDAAGAGRSSLPARGEAVRSAAAGGAGEGSVNSSSQARRVVLEGAALDLCVLRLACVDKATSLLWALGATASRSASQRKSRPRQASRGCQMTAYSLTRALDAAACPPDFLSQR